jgi:hypothetical protein
MNQETIEKTPADGSSELNSIGAVDTSFVERQAARDVRAKRQPLIKMLFERRLVLRTANGLLLAAMDLLLLFASRCWF